MLIQKHQIDCFVITYNYKEAKNQVLQDYFVYCETLAFMSLVEKKKKNDNFVNFIFDASAR